MHDFLKVDGKHQPLDLTDAFSLIENGALKRFIFLFQNSDLNKKLLHQKN